MLSDPHAVPEAWFVPVLVVSCPRPPGETWAVGHFLPFLFRHTSVCPPVTTSTLRVELWLVGRTQVPGPGWAPERGVPQETPTHERGVWGT